MTEAPPPPPETTPTAPVAAPQGNGIATAGLTVGIVAGVIAWFPCLPVVGLVLGVIGLILSVLGLKKSSVVGSGRGKAIAGLICSVIGILGGIIILVLWIGAIGASKTAFDKVLEMYNNPNMP